MGVIHGGESIDAFAEALQNALEAANKDHRRLSAADAADEPVRTAQRRYRPRK
jgi:hypothetical protein